MRLLSWILRLLVFAFLFALALKNTELAILRFYGGLAWQLPFILWLLIAFSLGAAFGVVAVFVRISRLRREVLKLKRELRARQHDTAAPPVPHKILDAI
jgi:uncharacterized integral membrane protein